MLRSHITIFILAAIIFEHNAEEIPFYTAFTGR